MDKLLEVQQKLIPDMLDLLQNRYRILQLIRDNQPVGRRILSQMLGETERIVRSEVEFLKQQELIDFQTSGMALTESGRQVLEDLTGLIADIKGIYKMETLVKESFKLKEVVIIPGDSDESTSVKREMGSACATLLQNRLQDKAIIAVTGGSTMAQVASAMTEEMIAGKEILFVPARGGIGEEVKNQANTIVAEMAQQTSGRHRALYAPDQISASALESFAKEPAIKEITAIIRSADIVLHGIGDASTMAKRRNTPEEDLQQLNNNHAVAEAFGYYFNEDGKVVHKISTIGLQLDDLAQAKEIIAVAGGSSKGMAISSYLKQAPETTLLITDEAAAKKMLAGK